MAQKLSRIRLVRINTEILVIVRKNAAKDDVISWFEKTEKMDVWKYELVSLTDKPDGWKTSRTFASLVEAKEFAEEDLPLFL